MNKYYLIGQKMIANGWLSGQVSTVCEEYVGKATVALIVSSWFWPGVFFDVTNQYCIWFMIVPAAWFAWSTYKAISYWRLTKAMEDIEIVQKYYADRLKASWRIGEK